MTTSGADAPIESTATVDACRAAYIQGKAVTKLSADSREILSGLCVEDWAAYAYLRFSGTETAFELTLEAAGGDCEIAVKAGVYLNIPACGHLSIKKGDTRVRCAVKTQPGVTRLYLMVTKADAACAGVALRDLKFIRADALSVEQEI